MASPVELALRQAVADLDALKVRWALIGGLAISVRSVPRFTKDLDFAIAAANDSEADRLGPREAHCRPRSVIGSARFLAELLLVVV